MKKITDLNNPKWKGHAVEDLKLLSSIKGGGKITGTECGTYHAEPGGGTWDESDEQKQYESLGGGWEEPIN